MKNFCYTLLLSLFALPLLAQPLSGSSNEEQLLIAADSARATNNWFVALENYSEAYDQNDELPIRPTIALMNLKLRDVKAAVRNYTQVFRRAEPTDTTNNIHRYHFARALKMDSQWDEARTYFENFLEHNTDERLAKFAKMELEGISLYKDAPQETSEVALEILDRKINSSFSEYSPVLSADGKTLYYSTWKATEAIIQGEGDDEKSYSQVFMSTMSDKGEWGKSSALGKEVNRPGLHTANPAISADGRRLYYNRLRMESNRIAEAKIYLSDVEDDGWKSGNPVGGINSSDYLALQPAPGELFGKEVLFFVSDMDGGFGGLDIYYATYEGDGRYSSPVNLGETVNSIGDDITPFYFDGTLYFSSDGRPTMGGKDLFYTAWNGSEWSEVKNMGVGFNSPVDDKSLSVFGEGLVGFMTSNREGGRSIKSKTCCDDIYGFQIASLYANLVVGLFSEAKQPLTTGVIELKPLLNGNPNGPGDLKSRDDGNRFDFGLDLETEYRVVASHPGYYPDTVEVNTLGLEESKEIQQLFFLKPLPAPPPAKDTTEVVVDRETAVTLENILYDFNDDKILPAAEGDLQVLQAVMEKYPDMVIELGSHTDSRGGTDFNLALSKRRAASARKWLIVNGGIAGPRIKTKGYGKTVPQTVYPRLAERYDFLNEGDILTDEFINSLADKPTKEIAHNLNRRTEFRVLEGPTEFKIRMDLIERTTPAPDRGAQPGSSKASVGVLLSGVEVPAASPKTDAQRSLRDPSRSATGNPQPATRNSQPTPRNSQPAPRNLQPAPTDSITRFSSLFGQKNLEGLPILQFDKRELDLGDVRHGTARSFEYTFTNTGKVPAKIMLIQACSCTTYTHDNSKVYGPGESGIIKVTFDSTEKEEDETITIDIYLEQTDSRDMPILEMVEYKYHLTK